MRSNRHTVTTLNALVDVVFLTAYTTRSFLPNGQVAQLVERGPEKAGVGGSSPSLATIKLRLERERVRGTEKALGFILLPHLLPFPLLFLSVASSF